MITRQDLIRGLGFNTQRAKAAVEGLSHEDTLLQPSVPGNCMNWVLGHMATSRHEALDYLGQPPLLTEAQVKRYGYGSEPICEEGEGVLRLEEILTLLERGEEALATALPTVSDDLLAEEVQSFMGPVTKGYMVFFMYWHESYHLGQTEILRELALAQSPQA
ncbi:MAG: DinB family protein [Chloroflexi bacterium]|nr:DinB family protein [Chloroflexota bacterium]